MKLSFPISLILVFFLSSCYQQISIVQVDDFSNIEIGFKELKADLDIYIYNPNVFKITVESAQIDLSVGDLQAGEVKLSGITTLNPQDTTTIHLAVKTSNGALAKILKENALIVLKGGKVPFTADGVIVAGAWKFKKELSVTHTEEIGLRN